MADMHSSKNVSVIGLGEMGAALTRALLAEGFSVTGWNRSPGKAERLAGQGLQIAATVLDAVTASPVIIACVSDYPILSALLHGDEVAAAMSGKTLIQLTTHHSAFQKACAMSDEPATGACGKMKQQSFHLGQLLCSRAQREHRNPAHMRKTPRA